jgi:serine protease
VKIKRSLKLALVCLLVGVVGGFWLAHRYGGAHAALGDYADAQPGFDASAAPAGEVVVDFDDDVGDDYVRAVGERLGLRLRPESRFTSSDRIYIATVDPAQEAAELSALRADPRVEAAEENLRFGVPEDALPAAEEAIPDDARAHRGPGGFPNDPRYDEQWHMEQIHMPATWKTAAGEGVIVAVIDTGVAHVEDLAQTEFVAGWNFVANNDNSDDDHGHGTHVAGTIAQSTHNGVGVAGVAYKARIMPLKVLSAGGSGSVAGIAEAVRFAADHGAKVINMSLGGPMNSQVLARAVKYAHDHGVTVVCAAGNDGRGRVSFPAANVGALAVAATQQDEKTTFYSNWGKQVAIAAPGGNTRERPTGGVLQNTRFQGKDDYYFFMGTSMASPHAAGVAALIVSQGVTDPDAVRDVMVRTARPPANMKQRPADYAEHYGAGIIDAAAAVHSAGAGSGGRDLAFAGGLGALVLLGLRRGRRLGGFGFGGVAGLVIGASGLFFLGALGLGTIPGAGILEHGFPAWDQALFGAAHHGNPLFYSALAPLLAVATLYSVRRLRGLIGGFAIGVGGHLVARALANGVDVAWVPFDALWLAVNGLVSVALGWLVLRR